MKVILIGHTPDADAICGTAAAVCTDYADGLKALSGALSCGHESVAEHASYTFLVEDVSRVLLAQITRHRLASFSVQSQRYVEGVPGTVTPPSIAADEDLCEEYYKLKKASAKFYNRCLDKGLEAEDARFGLLQGSETKFVVTMNARELKHFFELRMCNRAQWEIRQLADEMYSQVVNLDPVLFKNAGCGCMTNKGCPEGKRSCGHPRDNGKVVSK